MTALAANKERRKRNVGGISEFAYTPAASTQFYEGGLVCINASGLLVKAADTVNFRIVGVCTENYLSPASGARKVNVEFGHEEWFPCDANLQALAATTGIGKNATILDDQTASTAATTTNDIATGMVTEFETWNGVNGVWIKVGFLAAATN